MWREKFVCVRERTTEREREKACEHRCACEYVVGMCMCVYVFETG